MASVISTFCASMCLFQDDLVVKFDKGINPKKPDLLQSGFSFGASTLGDPLSVDAKKVQFTLPLKSRPGPRSFAMQMLFATFCHLPLLIIRRQHLKMQIEVEII